MTPGPFDQLHEGCAVPVLAQGGRRPPARGAPPPARLGPRWRGWPRSRAAPPLAPLDARLPRSVDQTTPELHSDPKS